MTRVENHSLKIYAHLLLKKMGLKGARERSLKGESMRDFRQEIEKG